MASDFIIYSSGKAKQHEAVTVAGEADTPGKTEVASVWRTQAWI